MRRPKFPLWLALLHLGWQLMGLSIVARAHFQHGPEHNGGFCYSTFVLCVLCTGAACNDVAKALEPSSGEEYARED